MFDQLQETGSNESYALFAFFPSDPNEEAHVELQFSIEDGAIGFDWVLLGEIKDRDADKFLDHARRLGYSLEQLEGNGVRYFRVTDGDLVNLCVSVMDSLYGVAPNTRIELVAKGFRVTGFPLSTQ